MELEKEMCFSPDLKYDKSMDDPRRRKTNIVSPNRKIIYVKTSNKLEQIELTSKCTTEDIEDVLRSVSGANRRDIIKLTNHQNVVQTINESSLEPNLPCQPYYIEVICCCPQLFTSLISEGARKSLQELDHRIENVERKMQDLFDSIHNSYPKHIVELENRLSKLQDRFQKMHLSRQLNREHSSTIRSRNTSEISTRCSSCPYFSNMHQMQQCVHLNDLSRSNPLCNWSNIGKTHKQIHNVWTQYQSIQKCEMRRHIKESLKQVSFNMWGYSDAELINLVKVMFITLDLTTKFCIPLTTLDQYLFAVYQNYNCVPFHNFTHAFCVIQMLYAIIHWGNLKEIFDSLEILILMFSALSHDLDHPGLNNAFQINARTCLAQRYNDQSPLENHHCAVAFQLLEGKNKNILKHLTEKQFKKLREISIKCILSTDMTKHSDIVNEFRNIFPKLDLTNDLSHRTMLMVVIIKLCDISNEARPPNISEPWLERLLEEFFQQSDLEKQKGLPWASFMDRDKVTKSNSQCGFISFVIMPLFELFVELFPGVEDILLKPVKCQLEFYTKLQNKMHSNNAEVSPSPNPVNVPVRKRSTGSIPSRKLSSGSISRRPSFSILDGALPPVRKTSIGSIPSRKSSTGSMVAANS